MFSKIILVVLLIPLTLAIPTSSSIDTPRTVGEPLGTWSSPPVVEICEGAPLPGIAVMDAVDQWRELGYPIIDIISETHNGPCQTGNVGGYIIIELDEAVPNPRTYLMVTDGEIQWAKIMLPGPIKARVIEHELGHTLGWNHNEIPGHIMNGNYERGGDSYRDLRVGPRYRPPPRSFPGARGPRRGTGRD